MFSKHVVFYMLLETISYQEVRNIFILNKMVWCAGRNIEVVKFIDHLKSMIKLLHLSYQLKRLSYYITALPDRSRFIELLEGLIGLSKVHATNWLCYCGF